jgi:hypothetical protein
LIRRKDDLARSVKNASRGNPAELPNNPSQQLALQASASPKRQANFAILMLAICLSLNYASIDQMEARPIAAEHENAANRTLAPEVGGSTLAKLSAFGQ